MLTEKEKLDILALLGIELNQVKDLDMLLERVLSEARHFTNADAGSIYIRHGDLLHFTYTQNETLQQRLPQGEKLIYSTFSMPIHLKSIAGYVAATGNTLNLPRVEDIPATAPYSFDRSFDEKSGYSTRSMYTIPLRTTRGDILGVLQLINAKNESGQIAVFPREDENMMQNFASLAAVALERAQMTRTILLRMIRMAELRDPKETGAHVNRVGGYTVELYEEWARRHELSKKELDKNRDSLRMAAMLHDVGKVAISDLILKKPGRFDQDEFEIMKQHTVLGARLFLDAQSEFDEAAGEVAMNHHERWDGKGYPGHVDAFNQPFPSYVLPNGKARGKIESEIPLYGRLVSLADVYDALSSARVYKEAWDEGKVLATITEARGSQFDPELVDIFFSKLDVLRSIQERYKESL
jgi:HD-GYP domain-containing protein (c-di-GMP phosphodiesterase class II)